MEDNLTAEKIEDNSIILKMEDNSTYGEMEDNLTAALSWMFMLGLAVIQVTHKHMSDIQDHSFTSQPSPLNF